MRFSNRKLFNLFSSTLTLILALTSGAHAAGLSLDSAGIRAGFPGGFSTRHFYHAAAYADWALPWRLEPGDFHFQPKLDLAAGWLGEKGSDAFFSSVGPVIEVSYRRLPVSVEGGISPTALSRSEFATKDVGTWFQFSSQVGLNWRFRDHWQLGYRYMHISNAGIAESNPGINLHVAVLAYRF